MLIFDGGRKYVNISVKSVIFVIVDKGLNISTADIYLDASKSGVLISLNM